MQTNALILGCCSNSEFRNCNFSKITLHFVTYYAVSIVLLKNHIPLENPQIPQREIFILYRQPKTEQKPSYTPYL